MAILTKDTTKKITIDLTGPQGNAYYLMGTAMKLCKQLNLPKEFVLNDMKAGDYECLIKTFDRYFGEYIDLE